MAKLNVQKALLKARSLARSGQTDAARRLYRDILAAYPKNRHAETALQNLDAAAPSGAAEEEDAGAEVPADALDRLLALYRGGKTEDALKRAAELLAKYPRAYLLWTIDGALSTRERRWADAARSFQRVVELKPDYPDGHNNLGAALETLDRKPEASAAYRRAIALNPDYVEAHRNLGAVLKDLGEIEPALASWRQALRLKPDDADVHNSVAIALQGLGRMDEAIESFERAIDCRPEFAVAYANLGSALRRQGRTAAARKAYETAVQLRPEAAEPHNVLGIVLQEQGDAPAAIERFRRALDLKPNYAEAQNNLGNMYKEQGQIEQAIACFRRAVEIRPDYASAQAQMLNQMQHISDWSAQPEFDAAARALGIEGDAAPPFIMLAIDDNAERQKLRAEKWARQIVGARSPAPLPRRARPEKLRIGYFSADFYNFAGMYLMAGLLESHDRDAFEIFAFSHGEAKDDHMRRRIIAGVDRFIDIREMTDAGIVAAVRDLEIDIAINRNGYTKDNRSGIFVERLAPVQIHYLGYPGAMGGDFMDYMVADRTVIPPRLRQHYAEKLIYLPHTYQPNDATRPIPETRTARAEFGLPNDAFVYCCFNTNYKITAHDFDRWMQALAQVDGSVLWLLRPHPLAETNLRREAANRGIAPERIVFAEKVPHHTHLARQKHADLFVDTFIYNAHTTASDALWAGLPLVTRAGEQFAARVAASLLTAIGLPELITTTEVEYEALIVALALDRDRLAAIRAKLARNRLTTPLFDTAGYTRDFERGLTAAHDRYLAGLPPADIDVASLP